MNKPKSNKDKILLAPSWGKDSFLFNDDIIQELYTFLSMKNADIILRPHPMHLKKVYENNLFQKLKFVIDKKNKNLDYLKDVILLITDWSGISLEYYFLNKSPTIFIDNNKTRRKLTKELNLVLIENKIRDKIGNIINPDDLSSLQNLNLKENIHLDDDYIDSIYKPEFINEKVSEIIILTF